MGARSAAARREYQAELQEMQRSMQSAQDQAADADARWRQTLEQLEHENQQLQVRPVLQSLDKPILTAPACPAGGSLLACHSWKLQLPIRLEHPEASPCVMSERRISLRQAI